MNWWKRWASTRLTPLFTARTLGWRPIFKRLAGVAVAGILLAGCADSRDNTSSVFPDLSLTSTPASAPADSGWQPIQPGMEQRRILIFDDAGNQVDLIYVLRVDPALFRFDVEYKPGSPQPLPAWLEESGAAAVVNGGFFTPEFEATGRIVVEGVGSGTSYGGDNAGMFAILPNGEPQIRWLGQRPYDANETFHAALQSFPMLVTPGGQVGYHDLSDRPARRTAVAQDKSGYILFIVAGWSHFKLAEFSEYLVNEDFGIDVALNLDGGTSSGILVNNWDGVSSYVPLPAIIAVYNRP